MGRWRPRGEDQLRKEHRRCPESRWEALGEARSSRAPPAGSQENQHPRAHVGLRGESPWGSSWMEGRHSAPGDRHPPQGPVPHPDGSLATRSGSLPAFQGGREGEMTQWRESVQDSRCPNVGAQTVAIVITRWKKGNGPPGATSWNNHNRAARKAASEKQTERMPVLPSRPCALPPLTLPTSELGFFPAQLWGWGMLSWGVAPSLLASSSSLLPLDLDPLPLTSPQGQHLLLPADNCPLWLLTWACCLRGDDAGDPKVT